MSMPFDSYNDMSSLPKHENNEELDELRRVENFHGKVRRNNNSIGGAFELNRILNDGGKQQL